jgi:hypothetical protein
VKVSEANANGPHRVGSLGGSDTKAVNVQGEELKELAVGRNQVARLPSCQVEGVGITGGSR